MNPHNLLGYDSKWICYSSKEFIWIDFCIFPCKHLISYCGSILSPGPINSTDNRPTCLSGHLNITVLETYDYTICTERHDTILARNVDRLHGTLNDLHWTWSVLRGTLNGRHITVNGLQWMFCMKYWPLCTYDLHALWMLTTKL